MLSVQIRLPQRGRHISVFLLTLSVHHQPTDGESWPKVKERLFVQPLSGRALPVWARWERQIIGADKTRNVARRGNSTLVEMWPTEDRSPVCSWCHPAASHSTSGPFFSSARPQMWLDTEGQRLKSSDPEPNEHLPPVYLSSLRLFFLNFCNSCSVTLHDTTSIVNE